MFPVSPVVQSFCKGRGFLRGKVRHFHALADIEGRDGRVLNEVLRRGGSQQTERQLLQLRVRCSAHHELPYRGKELVRLERQRPRDVNLVHKHDDGGGGGGQRDVGQSAEHALHERQGVILLPVREQGGATIEFPADFVEERKVPLFYGRVIGAELGQIEENGTRPRVLQPAHCANAQAAFAHLPTVEDVAGFAGKQGVVQGVVGIAGDVGTRIGRKRSPRDVK